MLVQGGGKYFRLAVLAPSLARIEKRKERKGLYGNNLIGCEESNNRDGARGRRERQCAGERRKGSLGPGAVRRFMNRYVCYTEYQVRRDGCARTSFVGTIVILLRLTHTDFMYLIMKKYPLSEFVSFTRLYRKFVRVCYFLKLQSNT